MIETIIKILFLPLTLPFCVCMWLLGTIIGVFVVIYEWVYDDCGML